MEPENKIGQDSSVRGGKYEKVVRNYGDDVDFQRRLRSNLQRAGYYAQSAGPAETAAAVTGDRAQRSRSARRSRRQSAANVEPGRARALRHRSAKRGAKARSSGATDRQTGRSGKMERH